MTISGFHVNKTVKLDIMKYDFSIDLVKCENQHSV